MSKNRLEIPSPDAATTDSLFIAYVMSALVLVGLGYYFNGMSDPVQEAAKKKAEITPEKKDPVVESLIDERSLASQFKSMKADELRTREWTTKERRAVYRFGPRNASEALCEIEKDKITSGKLEPEMRLELEKTLDRRTEFAPWSCLLRLHLDDQIADDGIKNEVESFTTELEFFKGNERLPMSLVDHYRETRNRPKSERFYRWLRRCALNNDYQPHVSCRKILRQISPAQGNDILEMYDLHIQKELVEKDVPMFVATLGRIARNGQPLNWNVKESAQLPDYNTDLKIGAVLALCRYALSPDKRTTFAAVEQLAKSGEISMRGNDKNTEMRWWITCSTLFGGDPKGEQVSPMLFIKASTEDTPHYDIGFLRDQKICAVKDGYPNWYCASEKWTSHNVSVVEAISDAFVKTAWIEFAEAPPLQLDPQTN